MGQLFKIFIIFLFLACPSLGEMSYYNIGHAYAIIGFTFFSDADIRLPYASGPLTVLKAKKGESFQFKVDWQTKDSSFIYGYPLSVSANILQFYFSDWSWHKAGNEFIETGPNLIRGGYDYSGIWEMDPSQDRPVTKYKLTLASKTRGRSKVQSEEFYAALAVPDSGTRNTDVRKAAPGWIAGRYERAYLFWSLGQILKNISRSSLVDYNEEMAKIFRSADAIFSPPTVQSFVAESGFDFLELASENFADLDTSNLISEGGEIYLSYNWGKIAKGNFKPAGKKWDSTFKNLVVQIGLSMVGDSLGNALDSLSYAMRDEADEAMRIMYIKTGDSADDWRSKLADEKARLDLASQKAFIASNVLKDFFDKTHGSEGIRTSVLGFLEAIFRLALFEKEVLNKAF